MIVVVLPGGKTVGGANGDVKSAVGVAAPAPRCRVIVGADPSTAIEHALADEIETPCSPRGITYGRLAGSDRFLLRVGSAASAASRCLRWQRSSLARNRGMSISLSVIL